MSYTNQQGEKVMLVVLPKPSSELVSSLHIGIRGTFE
jgi:hypothetical protein